MEQELRRALTARPRCELEAEAGRRAAVLVLIYPLAGEPAVLLTRRRSHLGRHPGEVSFPGGGCEAGDDGVAGAALREAHEEIGLDAGRVAVVGMLDDMPTLVSGMVVTPVVATAADLGKLHADPGEVAEIIEVPLRRLVDPNTFRRARLGPPGGYVTCLFDLGSVVVWGLTGRILDIFLEVAAPVLLGCEMPEPKMVEAEWQEGQPWPRIKRAR